MLHTSPVRNNYKGCCLWAQENKSFTPNAGNKEIHVTYSCFAYVHSTNTIGIGTMADSQQLIGEECHHSPLKPHRWVCFSSGRGNEAKNDGVFVFRHFFSLRPHQGWAWQTSSVNLGFLPSVSPSAARLGGGEVSSCRKWPFWSDCLLACRLALRGKTKTRQEKKRWLSANAPRSN